MAGRKFAVEHLIKRHHDMQKTIKTRVSRRHQKAIKMSHTKLSAPDGEEEDHLLGRSEVEMSDKVSSAIKTNWRLGLIALENLNF